MALSPDAAGTRMIPLQVAPVQAKAEPNKKATEITQSVEVVEASSDGFDEGVEISLTPPIG